MSGMFLTQDRSIAMRRGANQLGFAGDGSRPLSGSYVLHIHGRSDQVREVTRLLVQRVRQDMETTARHEFISDIEFEDQPGEGVGKVIVPVAYELGDFREEFTNLARGTLLPWSANSPTHKLIVAYPQFEAGVR
jgi:hypothetical protein